MRGGNGPGADGELDARCPGSARPERPDAAVVDALHVKLICNCANRLANAFGFAWDWDKHVRVNVKVIRRISCRLPGFLLR